eukprot:6212548-Pleurochrysis_carterae.AAC.2
MLVVDHKRHKKAALSQKADRTRQWVNPKDLARIEELEKVHRDAQKQPREAESKSDKRLVLPTWHAAFASSRSLYSEASHNSSY